MIKGNLKYVYTLITIGGICLKKDFIIYLTREHKSFTDKAGKNAASKNLRVLLNNNWIEIIPKEEHGTHYDYLRVTDKGYVRVADKLKLKVNELTNRFPRNASYTSAALIDALTKARTLITMKSCGVPCTPDEKPSLETLANQNITTKREPYKQFTPDEIKTLLQGDDKHNGGVFYNDSEVRNLMFTLTQGELDRLDTTIATRFAGVFVSYKRVLIIFTQDIGETHQLTVGKYSVLSLIEIIRLKLLPLTTHGQIVRKYNRSENTNYALVITNSMQTVYSSVTGNVYGRGNPGGNKDGLEVHQELKEKNQLLSNMNTNSRYRLAPDLSKYRIFEKIFMAPMSHDGMRSIHYAIHTSDREQAAYYHKTLSGSGFKYLDSPYDVNFPAHDLTNDDAPATFLPVPELNTLRKIHEAESKRSIVTYDFLIDCFSRCIRRDDTKYYSAHYDEDTNTILVDSEPDVVSYTKTGFEPGKEKLMVRLKELRVHYSTAEYAKLPTLFNLSKNDFWDKVNTDEITFEDITKAIAPTPDRKRKKKKHLVVFELTEEGYRYLKRQSSIRGVTMKSIIMPLIQGVIDGKFDDVLDELAKQQRLEKENPFLYENE